jgi:hypothetical protein
LKGKTKVREVITRVNQSVFRLMVLVNYNRQCVITDFVKYFAPIEKVKLQMPQKYLPKREFLEWHLDCVFEKK